MGNYRVLKVANNSFYKLWIMLWRHFVDMNKHEFVYPKTEKE